MSEIRERWKCENMQFWLKYYGVLLLVLETKTAILADFGLLHAITVSYQEMLWTEWFGMSNSDNHDEACGSECVLLICFQFWHLSV